ncbi:fimbrial protein [Pragia fontium]|uniref:Fimbrial protein n=1 Tax=Pragia fontium TaxID=82985 RepID=A0ABQ5LGP9_9GAMM|nr:fimbrial protein [Pragia fontium]
MVLSFQAQATLCGPWAPDDSDSVIVPLIGSGTITAGNDLPIGATLYRLYYKPKLIRRGWLCKPEDGVPNAMQYTGYIKAEAITMPFGPPTNVQISGDGTHSVFPTNVPGIGYILSPGSNTIGNGIYPYLDEINNNLSSGSGGYSVDVSNIVIRLVKTGPIPSSAQVLASSFPTIQFSEGGILPTKYEHIFLTIGFSGTLNVVNGTCLVEQPDVSVSLGTHDFSNFTKVGSATKWQDFKITLKDCSPFYGSYPNPSDLGYSAVDGIISNKAPIPNQIKLALTAVYGSDERRKVAYLDGEEGSAVGIGVQITRQDISAAYPLTGTSWPVPIQLSQVDGASYDVLLKARYYQYQETIQAGKANTSVVYTISYH